jgi:hypothetical protein
MAEAADRILTSLRKNPHLMWEIALGIRIVGPWEIAPEVGGPSMFRADPWGNRVVTIRSAHRMDTRYWLVQVKGCPDFYVGHHADHQKVLDKADAHIRGQGIVLLDG